VLAWYARQTGELRSPMDNVTAPAEADAVTDTQTDGYQACTLNCCLGRIPVARAL